MRNPRKVRSVMGCEDRRQLSEPGDVAGRACCSRSMVIDGWGIYRAAGFVVNDRRRRRRGWRESRSCSVVAKRSHSEHWTLTSKLVLLGVITWFLAYVGPR